jgi:cell division protein FtsN
MNDYKPRPKRKSASFGNTLLGIFIGLFLGLVIASAIAVYMMKSPLPFVSRSKAGDRASSAEQAPKARPETKNDTVAAAGKDQRGEKTKLDFYEILPGGKAGEPAAKAQPERVERIDRAPKAENVERVDKIDQAAVAKAQELTRDAYMIQAGSFQNPADADNVKAKLALLGLQASIEPAALPDKGTWYRVRLGPYRNLKDINTVRSQLAQAGIDATLLKIKE